MPSLPAGVHEAGKSAEKADGIFSQERDPRFAEMFAGISACKFPAAPTCRGCGAGPSGAEGAAGDGGRWARGAAGQSPGRRSPNGAPRLPALPLAHLLPGAPDPSPPKFEGLEETRAPASTSIPHGSPCAPAPHQTGFRTEEQPGNVSVVLNFREVQDPIFLWSRTSCRIQCGWAGEGRSHGREAPHWPQGPHAALRKVLLPARPCAQPGSRGKAPAARAAPHPCFPRAALVKRIGTRKTGMKQQVEKAGARRTMCTQRWHRRRQETQAMQKPESKELAKIRALWVRVIHRSRPSARAGFFFLTFIEKHSFQCV